MKKLDFASNQRWKVIFSDSPHWKAGVYVPENRRLEDVKYLEKHDCPELFLLLEGEVFLVLGREGKIRVERMQERRGYIVEEWHNAFGQGRVLVIERGKVKTEFKKVDDFQLIKDSPDS